MKETSKSLSFLNRIKRVFFLLGLFIFVFHVHPVYAKSISIKRIWTSDTDGNGKTTFSPDAKITVHAEITPDANNPVSVSGKIIGTKKSKNGRRGKKWLEQLDKQTLEAGGQSAINWTETIPENAKLSSKAIIRVRARSEEHTSEL